MHYSLPLANWLMSKGYSLYGKSDLKFVEGLYKVLRNAFNYQPKLTREQFLSSGYAERKVMLTYDLLKLCQIKHVQLSSKKNVEKRCVVIMCIHNYYLLYLLLVFQQKSFIIDECRSPSRSADGAGGSWSWVGVE